MSGKRTYADPCGIARALDRVGDRWALLVVRELVLGPKRFTDLRAGLPTLTPDVLSRRLTDLEEAGVVRRRLLPPPAASRVYELTDSGRGLEPVLIALGRWGSRAPFPAVHGPLGTDALILALKTTFDPATAPEGLGLTVELRLGEQTFTAEVRDGRFEVARREPAEPPDGVITTDPATLTEIVFHGRPLADAERAGTLAITGRRAAVTEFLRLFAAPPAAS